MGPVQLGIDAVRRSGISLPGSGRAGVLSNASTVAADWLPTAEALALIPGLRLERIFSPQHGYAAEKQDNMKESADGVHPGLGIPIHSLYGERREPAAAAFDGLDLLFIDLQDVGTRVYTFLVTALLAIRGALRAGVPVIILDRPNPIGGEVEGPLLAPGFESFVGIIDVPLRHGLTPGEFCIYGAWRLGLISETDATRIAAGIRSGASDSSVLRVVPLRGYARSSFYDETGLPWTMPSPNMPAIETAVVYPGQVIVEGTNLSEGRGTTRPFEIFGAPYLDPHEILRRMSDRDLEGALLRGLAFEPTFNKHAGELVRGFQVHVLDRTRFRPVRFTTALLAAVRAVHGDAFAWKEPPYEYVWDRPAVDVITGSDRFRRAIDAGEPAEAIAASWEPEIRAFKERMRPFLLYD